MLARAWNWLTQSLRTARAQRSLQRRAIGDDLWQQTLQALPFVTALPAQDLQRLRTLASLFLDDKEFSGARGWQVSDAQAVMVAVQACLPLLHIAPPDRPDLALAWYDSFVGIVLHAGEVRAQRSVVDEAGVEHLWQENLTGEAMEGGPLMLAWSDVADAGTSASSSYNVVIHEFVHVMDMRSGAPDGCPPMPAEQRRDWMAVMQEEYRVFCEHAALWERFGDMPGYNATPAPLLDHYGTSSIEEFFAVAAEAYFVRRNDFAAAHPRLLAQFDRFFKPYPSGQTGTAP